MRFYKSLFVSILFVSQFSFISFSQDVYLNDQASVDAFDPTISVIEGDLSIGAINSDITDLSNLDNIVTVTEDLRIQHLDIESLTGFSNLEEVLRSFTLRNNDNLMTINGFNKLSHIGDNFFIENNNSLTSLESFNTVNNIGGAFSIVNNDGLIDLEGLNLTQIVGNIKISNNANLLSIEELNTLTTARNIEIYYNPLLGSLNGLNNLTIVRGLEIDYNSSLSNLNAMISLTEVEYNLTITRNESLTSLEGLINLTKAGGVYINGNDGLQNLLGLNNLVEIAEDLTGASGHLRVIANESLMNLEGLNNLISIQGDLQVDSNDLLNSLEALSNLSSVTGNGILSNNPSLTNFHGLSNVTHFNSLTIEKNNILSNLEGLNNLTQLELNLNIIDNDELENIDALKNLSKVDSLGITGNLLLSDCCGIAPLIGSYGGNLPNCELKDNDLGCNSQVELLESCGYSAITIMSYYDLNENGLKGLDEPIISNVLMNVNSQQFYTTSENFSDFFIPNGEVLCTVDQSFLDTWNITSDSMSYSFLFDDNFTDTLSFGFYPKSFNRDISTTIHADNFRCDTEARLFVNARNNGTTILNEGVLWLEIDTLIDVYTFIDQPDIISTSHKVGWFFNALNISQVLDRSILLTVPGVNVLPLGSSLKFRTYLTSSDQLGNISTYGFTYNDIVTCAYDPNDKIVQPQRFENYTLFDEYLNFTIRFQNTGNAEAYDVTVYDALDEKLDASTFRLITSSHLDVLTTSLIDNGTKLRFYFEDINLPDSLSDYAGSQGFINFEIKTKTGLDEGVTVENEASIYFDQNPPIVTNTTNSVMVTTLDYDEDGYFFWDDCDDYNDLVNPDNVEIPYNGFDDDCDVSTLDNDLDQDGFYLNEDCDDQNATINPSAIEIPDNGIDENCDGSDLMVSVSDILLSSIELFPNPVNSTLFIESNETKFTNKILNSLGQLVWDKSEFGDSQEIDVSNWNQGVYYVQLQVPSGETVVKKVMVVD